ncbi:MAG: hypothetical protein HXX12_13795 [Geothrix sp.]|uniref:PEP/pyruvate-binding domain-containing protein n=1 Tax=Geothrix sp. TaxID=1962974 RepID=UPI001803D11C|nr:PEP/pyruvate-binding domain-containing protein [Geothrix sp.]NWJ42031.1 hypothetical protein [Geothrix sp.]WIL20001.1 MAG: PEP-utilizing enzyme [Geothrix sp.]
MKLIHDFTELLADPLPPAELGGKARGLLELLTWGLPVPPGAVLPASAFRRFLAETGIAATTPGEGASPAEVCDHWRGLILAAAPPPWLDGAVRAWVSAHPGQSWAVRSSAIQEDLPGHSFAGQYSSFLHQVTVEQITRSILACWASLYNPGAVSYCQERGLPLESSAMAVILQRMVRADHSGVLFTVDPIGGRDTVMLVEAVHGLGESLVQGRVTPDCYRFDWFAGREVERSVARKEWKVACADGGGVMEGRLDPKLAEAPVLSPEALGQLCGAALDIQRRSGYPVDIEWAFAEGTLHILQSRPETRIHVRDLEGEWTTADFKDGGVSSTVCTPFMWALYDLVWERAMPEYLRSVRMIDAVEGIVWGDMFFGRPYWNVGIIKTCLERLPGFTERHFDADLGIEPAYAGEGRTSRLGLGSLWRALRVVLALKRSFQAELEACEAFRARQLARLRELDGLDLHSLDEQAFFAFYWTFIEQDFFRSEYAYFHLIFNNSNFQSLYKGELQKQGADILLLLSGLQELSHLQPNYRLWELSRQLRTSPGACAYWRDTPLLRISEALRSGEPGPGFEELRAHIEAFKFHSTRELDIRVPRLDEDPSQVLSSLRQLIDLDDAHSPQDHTAAQSLAAEQERQRFIESLPPWKRKASARKIERMRRFLWWREEYRDLSTRHYHLVRKVTLHLAGRLLEGGWLATAEDVFFLDLADLFGLLDGRATRTDVKERIRLHRAYYDSFRNFQNPDELGRGRDFQPGGMSRQAGEGALTGLPCSPGQAEGPARLIADIFEADRLAQGDILLTRYTDPGWTPCFGLIAGVATETGGLLSHAAVISREYGIPAVLAVKGLLSAAAGAQRASLDGHAGQVRFDEGGPR